MPEPKLKLRNDVINGFSYSFSRTLLDSLKDALEKEKVFEKSYWEQEEIIQKNYGQELAFNLEPGFQPVCQYLSEQTVFSNFASNYRGVQRLIKHAEKFLSIFEGPVESKTEPKPKTDHYGPGLGEDDNSLPQVEDDSNIPF